ncbi:response regulator transcription factor [Ectopseudomonas mendocina]|uniref:Response regulator transcription factor n=1 Tax=Ectopseudomonas mendocina TaxID=300 RepID=A0ABZ2RI15_ECTME
MLASNVPAARILVVEDDPLLAAHLHKSLMDHGYQVTLSNDGREGLELARSGDFDLILQDILLPGVSGLDALQTLRKDDVVPVILMSALGEEQDRIAGFSQGADDYLPKPFSMAELQVRVEAVLRRVAYERAEPANLNPDPQLIFEERRTDVCMNGAWADLTSTEYRVLEALMRDEGEVLTKAFLYQQVLHRAYSRHDRSLDMHISHIRRKLQLIGYTAGRIDTVWGKGYVLTRLET